MWRRLFIKGKEYHYDISDSGNVRNSKTLRLLTPNPDRNGYMVVTISRKGKQKGMKVHRLVAMTFIPNPNNYPEVNHLNGKKYDNRVENLEWCTSAQNVKHAFATGLHKPMILEEHPNSIYTNEQVEKACELLDKGYSYSEISEITGIRKKNVTAIRYGYNWRHIAEKYDFFKKPRRKLVSHKMFSKSVDKAILNGIGAETIVSALTKFMSLEEAKSLYYYRKRIIRNHKSPVQCDIFVDDGEEIF